MSDELGLPVEIVSEDGIAYTIDLIPTDYDYVKELWTRLLELKMTLSSVGKLEDFKTFASKLLDRKQVFLGIMCEEKFVGIAYIHDLIPGYEATFNYTFWDRKTTGRQALVMGVLHWFGVTFSIQRFEFRLPSFAFRAIHRLYSLGVMYEGTKRNAWRHGDVMLDLHFFSILFGEITEEALSTGIIPRKKSERRWYGKITKHGGSNG